MRSQWQALVLIATVLASLVGCNGNYKFSDSEYRPLGDPQAVNRSK
jgi:hypothetical protein